MIDVRMRLPNEFRSITIDEMKTFYGKYEDVFDISTMSKIKGKHLLQQLKASEIAHAVVHAEYEYAEDASKLNDSLASFISEYPDSLSGFGTVDLANLKPKKLVKEAERIKSYGLKGINLQPIFFDVDPLDRRLYPLYSKAEQLGLIVSFHTGIHYSLHSSFINNNPLFIDQIAVDFPDLKIIACHAGWPWVAEMAAIARRHSHVFLEFGGLDPRYIAKQGSGWEPLFTLMDNLLQNQILFGTDWPVIAPNQVIDGWQQSELKESTLDKLFTQNARKLLQL